MIKDATEGYIMLQCWGFVRLINTLTQECVTIYNPVIINLLTQLGIPLLESVTNGDTKLMIGHTDDY